MSNIYGLLNLDSVILKNFALQGRYIEKNIELDRILRNATHRLDAIKEKMHDGGERPAFNSQSIDEVIAKVKRDSVSNEEQWSIKELRIVSYYLVRFRNQHNVFDYAIRLLETNWKDLYIRGLMFFLMNSWNSCPSNLLINVRGIIIRHLVNYAGPIKHYQILKNQVDLLESAGPIRLSALLSAKGLPPESAPKILGYKTSALSFPYFSDVIIDYFRQKQEVDYDEMEDIFRKHSLDRTKKMMYAYLVEKAEDSNDGNFQGAVVRSARRVLGDINLSTTWSPFTGATPQDIWQLNKAKDLVIAWGARKTIDAFFDICVQDPYRRKCWLEYINNIMDYRIVGSTSVRTKLQANSEVAPLLNSCFIKTNSRVSTTAALVLFIKDKVFVEFSDVGALYIYNASNYIIRGIKGKSSLDSTANLKNTSIGMAVENNYYWDYTYADEGKITHRGEWQDRLQRWMKNKMGIRPGQKVGYSIPKPATEHLQYSRETIIAAKSAASSNSIASKTAQVGPARAASTSASERQLLVEKPRQSMASSAENEHNTIKPGTRIKTEIHGIRSKRIFDDSCQVLADKDGIYIYIKSKQRTYYVSPSELIKPENHRIFLISSDHSKTKYEVRTAIWQSSVSSFNSHTIGFIERSGSDIIYTTLDGKKVRIHI